MITQTKYFTKLRAFKKAAGICPKAFQYINGVAFAVVRQYHAIPYFVARHSFLHEKPKQSEKTGYVEKRI